MENRVLLDAEQVQREQIAFIYKVYAWMGGALLLTAVVALLTASSPVMIQLIFGSKILFYGLIIGELALVWYLSAAIQRMSATAATGWFLAYAFVNGLTLSFIFLVYTAASLAGTFFVTAATFGAMSVYGYFTKRDLTTWGNLLFMALIGLILASLVNMFFNNEMIYWITTYVGIIIFVGLVAYDTQKIKNMNIIGNEGTEEDHKEAIMGALALYLDFINLFLYLLRVLGRRNE
ncbi:MAG: Bax inhibitor-1/YccA family protein [Saprospirales bacterium]|nr:Bax inhibitor-1/YccA family protein [Saprospirales bacterium]